MAGNALGETWLARASGVRDIHLLARELALDGTFVLCLVLADTQHAFERGNTHVSALLSVFRARMSERYAIEDLCVS